MFLVRPTNEADRPALARLLTEVWPHNTNAIAYHGGGNIAGWVALIDNEIIGYAHATRKKLHPTHIYIGIHVAPKYRHQGIGSALYKALTSTLHGTLKTATDAEKHDAVQFLQKRGFAISVQTQQPKLNLALLDTVKVRSWQVAAEALGFELLSMTVLSGPHLEEAIATLHRQVYARTHAHDPANTSLLDAEDFLGNDLNPAWLFVARDIAEGQLAGVASVRLTDDAAQGDLGWCGVWARFANVGQPLTLALTALALEAAQQSGINECTGEFDGTDTDIMHVYAALPWQDGSQWLTLTTGQWAHLKS